MSSIRRDREVLDLLYRMAIDHDPKINNRAKVTAGIVVRGKLISIGFNQAKTHPFQLKFSKNNDSIYLHAEIAAIKNSMNHMNPLTLKKATLYIARAKNGDDGTTVQWGQAMPCKGCSKAINFFKIRRVVYTTNINDMYEEQNFRY